jgi:hypothetical protein
MVWPATSQQTRFLPIRRILVKAELSMLVVVLACLTSLAPAQGHPSLVPPAAADQTTCISHVTVIDTGTGKEVRDRAVVISKDRISAVKASNEVHTSACGKTIDGTGKYLIPGLWDMHAHMTSVDSTLPLYIANGVTGVREMFGPPDANKFRSNLAAKHIVAPHIYLASPLVDGYPPAWPLSIVVKTAAEGRAAVDDQKQKGADFIKVYGGLSREAYYAILDESKRQGIPAEGHVPDSISAWEATAAGQKSMEHLNGLAVACSTKQKELMPKVEAAMSVEESDPLFLEAAHTYSEEKCQRLFAEFKKNGTWQVPTLTLWLTFARFNDPQFTSDDRLRYFGGQMRGFLTGKDPAGNVDARFQGMTESSFAMNRQVLTNDEKLVGAMFRAGVPILAGTDNSNPYVFPGFSLHDELALLVESGLTPLGALQAATRNPAIFMNAQDQYGSVTAGKIADLVLLNADPLADIHNTTRIATVFLGGKEFDHPALDQILSSAESAANPISAH